MHKYRVVVLVGVRLGQRQIKSLYRGKSVQVEKLIDIFKLRDLATQFPLKLIRSEQIILPACLKKPQAQSINEKRDGRMGILNKNSLSRMCASIVTDVDGLCHIIHINIQSLLRVLRLGLLYKY